MSITLFANPYDINATGFYFENSEQFNNLYDTHAPVEEYEVEFIDGPSEALELFEALKISQCHVGDFFDSWDEIEDDPQLLAAICFLITTHGIQVFDEAKERAQEIGSFEGSLEDYAQEFVEECIFTKDTPEVLKQYFDFKSFARDLELEGSAETFEFCGSKYVFTGA